MVKVNAITDYPKVLNSPVPGDISYRTLPAEDTDQHDTERTAAKTDFPV